MRGAILVVLLAACGDDVAMELPDADVTVDAMDMMMGMPSIEGTPVSSFESTSCSTGDVLALSRQIAEQANCDHPGQLVAFAEQEHIMIVGSAVLPYMGEDARDDLYAAAAAGGDKTIEVTSGYRTVVQQYLLYRWHQLGRCGITAAADPGTSNHESGRAVDVSNYSSWVSLMGEHGWAHDVAGDPVHFDHLASPDIRGADILAFQELWNLNAPDDPISADGDYGPATAERVKRAPAEGFGLGAECE